MSIRDILKQREEARDNASKGDTDFPDGVTRYVKVGSYGEINKEGRTLVLLASPDDWYVYFIHEDKTYNGKGYDHNFRKHTCLHSPKDVDIDAVLTYFKPGKAECISCKAGAKRKMFFMIPVYDLEYKTFRVIDIAEFHATNIISDYDKAEKMGRKFNPAYTLVGEAVHFKQVDKSYSLESGEATDEQLAEAKAFIGFDFKFAELANFREVDDIVTLLNDAAGGVDKSVLGSVQTKANASAGAETPSGLPEDEFQF